MRKRKTPNQVNCAPCSRPILPHKKVPTVLCALQAFHNEKVPASQESPHSAALSLHIKACCGWKLLKFYKLTLSPSALKDLMHQRGHSTINTLQLCCGIHSFWSWRHRALSIIFILHEGCEIYREIDIYIYIYIYIYYSFPVAQLVEHGASNAKTIGSIPRESKSW